MSIENEPDDGELPVVPKGLAPVIVWELNSDFRAFTPGVEYKVGNTPIKTKHGFKYRIEDIDNGEWYARDENHRDAILQMRGMHAIHKVEMDALRTKRLREQRRDSRRKQ